jgi:PmbA protein
VTRALQPLTDLIETARRRGARAAEALLTESEGLVLEVQRGKLTRQEPVREAFLTVRVWGDHGGEGTATGSPEEALRLAELALEAAARAAADPNAGPVPKIANPPGGLGIDDKRHGQLTLGDRTEVVLAAEKGARTADRRARTDDFRYSDRRTRRALVNTRGLAVEEWSTLYRAQGRVSMGDDANEVRLWDDLASRAFASIASLPYGTSLAQRAAGLMGSGPSVSGPTRVVLPPRCVAALFERIGALFASDEPTFLSRAPRRKDDPVIDPRLHLLDDGTVPGSLRTCAFDDRGVTPVPLTLLKEGRPDKRLVDNTLARRAETRPTGHWHGDGLRPNNLILRGGTRSLNALLIEMDSPVLVVDDVIDWSGLDLATGRARLRANGHVQRKTNIDGPVRDFWLTGDLVEVLNKVVEVASDTDRHGHVDAPAVVVDGFTVGR